MSPDLRDIIPQWIQTHPEAVAELAHELWVVEEALTKVCHQMHAPAVISYPDTVHVSLAATTISNLMRELQGQICKVQKRGAWIHKEHPAAKVWRITQRAYGIINSVLDEAGFRSESTLKSDSRYRRVQNELSPGSGRISCHWDEILPPKDYKKKWGRQFHYYLTGEILMLHEPVSQNNGREGLEWRTGTPEYPWPYPHCFADYLLIEIYANTDDLDRYTCPLSCPGIFQHIREPLDDRMRSKRPSEHYFPIELEEELEPSLAKLRQFLTEAVSHLSEHARLSPTVAHRYKTGPNRRAFGPETASLNES